MRADPEAGVLHVPRDVAPDDFVSFATMHIGRMPGAAASRVPADEKTERRAEALSRARRPSVDPSAGGPQAKSQPALVNQPSAVQLSQRAGPRRLRVGFDDPVTPDAAELEDPYRPRRRFSKTGAMSHSARRGFEEEDLWGELSKLWDEHDRSRRARSRQ